MRLLIRWGFSAMQRRRKVDMLEKYAFNGGSTMKQAEIDSMSVDEKLHTIEALWNALSDDDVVSPQWHYEVVEERSRSLENGGEVISLDELKKRI